MKKVYLACPYSHEDEKVMVERFNMANKAAALLMKKGCYVVFSPISHSHPISLHIDNCKDHDFWLKQDYEFMKWCDKLIILEIEGWEESKGVNREIEWAMDLGKNISRFRLPEKTEVQ
jgi:nucleoside 2-deoxyribosyltransferase